MKRKVKIKKLNDSRNYALVDLNGEIWASGYLDLDSVYDDLESNSELYELVIE